MQIEILTFCDAAASGDIGDTTSAQFALPRI